MVSPVGLGEMEMAGGGGGLMGKMFPTKERIKTRQDNFREDLMQL